MRFLVPFALLLLGFATPAFGQTYPANPIQWRPADEGVAWGPVWGYDENGDIACASYNGAACINGREIANARSAERTLSCGDQMRTHYGFSGYDTEGHWCRELALRHGNRHGFKWRAPAHGVNLYWRRNPDTGNVECASFDGNCFALPILELAFKGTQVLACKPEDYNQAGHWCNGLAGERRGNGYDWKRSQRLHFGRPMEDAIEERFFSYSASGDIQCPSDDGEHCRWSSTREEAEAATRTLACGAQHEALFGVTGYDTPGHWCRNLALTEGNASGFTTRWGRFGLAAGWSWPEVMCASANGRDCHWWFPLSASFKDADPLICGRDHGSKFGGTGYEPEWCQRFGALEVRGHYIRVQNTSGQPVRVCRPVWFDAADREAEFANIRCTELAAAGEGYATAMAITLLPLGVHEGTRTVHQAVCVETADLAGLFLGPVMGNSAQVSIDATRIGVDTNMLDLTAGRRTCRDAFATLSNL